MILGAKNGNLFSFFAPTGCGAGETFCVFDGRFKIAGEFCVALFILPEILACSPFAVGIGCNDFEFGNIAFIIFFNCLSNLFVYNRQKKEEIRVAENIEDCCHTCHWLLHTLRYCCCCHQPNSMSTVRKS